MADSLAAIVLAAGLGTRMRPLTRVRPKALCPVGNVPLVDLALERVAPVTTAVAVNVHHGRRLMEAHLGGRVHLSVEEPEVLGTAGAVANLLPWVDGRDVLVVNADAWHRADLGSFVAGWDRARVRLLVQQAGEAGDFGPWRYIGAALMPWDEVRHLPVEPSGLYEVSWRHREADGRLDLVPHDGVFHDCGTPRSYLAANMAASGGQPVVGAGAVVEGTLVRSVVWPGGRVRAGERLVDAVRVGSRMTVCVR